MREIVLGTKVVWLVSRQPERLLRRLKSLGLSVVFGGVAEVLGVGDPAFASALRKVAMNAKSHARNFSDLISSARELRNSLKKTSDQPVPTATCILSQENRPLFILYHDSTLGKDSDFLVSYDQFYTEVEKYSRLQRSSIASSDVDRVIAVQNAVNTKKPCCYIPCNILLIIGLILCGTFLYGQIVCANLDTSSIPEDGGKVEHNAFLVNCLYDNTTTIEALEDKRQQYQTGIIPVSIVALILLLYFGSRLWLNRRRNQEIQHQQQDPERVEMNSVNL